MRAQTSAILAAEPMQRAQEIAVENANCHNRKLEAAAVHFEEWLEANSDGLIAQFPQLQRVLGDDDCVLLLSHPREVTPPGHLPYIPTSGA